MGFFTVHFDDSGTHPESSTAVCACWIASVEQWDSFCRDWKAASEQEEFGVFHMADFYRGEKQFLGWNDERKKRLLNRLCMLINTRTRRGCGFGVTKRDYEQVVPPDDKDREHFGKFHYTFAMRSSIGFVSKWRHDFEKDSSLRYVFDRVTKGTGAKGEIESVMDEAVELSERESKQTGIRNLVGYSFEDKEQILPLQASDILAWTVFQKMLANADVRQLNWAASTVIDYLGKKIESGYFDRETLGRWVSLERTELRKREL